MRDEQDGAVAVHDERVDEQLQPNRECERLVRVLAAERYELVVGGGARDHVTVGHASHRHVGDDRLAVRARNADGDRIRPGELRASIRMAETRGRGCGEDREEAARGETAGPVAEHAGGKAVVSHDQPGGLGRILQLARADRSQGEVAERTTAFPPLVAGFRDDALGLRARVDSGQSL